METSSTTLEDLYAQLSLEEDEESGVIVPEGQVKKQHNTYVLVGKFLTEKNINFNAMQNVLASLWRPKEGMEIHDLGGHRYSFVFFHVLDMRKVLEGGPWTFEQSLLVYQKLQGNEDPHLVKLHKSDIWVHVYDMPQGFMSENILMNIGNFVGQFVKSDPNNFNESWRMYARIRVTMDLEKPLRRRMKIKREGGEWSWVNFKYERLSTFCFVCGLMGHSDRDCSLVYANPEMDIPRAYGVWLRAPNRNTGNQNSGAKWLRSGNKGEQTREGTWMTARSETTVSGGDKVEARFMEIDGKLSEINVDSVGIMIVQKIQEREIRDKDFANQKAGNVEGNQGEIVAVVTDPKRRRVEPKSTMDEIVGETTDGPSSKNGPKNLTEAGPGSQARLIQ